MALTRVGIEHFYPFGNDALFDPESPWNRDDCFAFYRLLRARLEEAGGFCHTLDVCRARGLEPDVVLCFEMPRGPVEPLLAGWSRRPQAWVVLMECPVILPHNWDAARHAQFQKLFTWHDPIVDGERYVKLNFPNALFVPEPLDVEAAQRNLCTIVAGNKAAAHPLELYSQRRAAIRWFELQHPEHFDLYGKDWDRPTPGLPAAGYPSWRGAVESKLETLERYWFSICFENARDIPGYITEKLFDCLLARTVPVYWGPQNITDHVPADVFIDIRRFQSFEQLYAHLTAMEPDEYQGYLQAARRFLAGPAAHPFSNEGCVETLVAELARAGRGLCAA